MLNNYILCHCESHIHQLLLICWIRFGLLCSVELTVEWELGLLPRASLLYSLSLRLDSLCLSPPAKEEAKCHFQCSWSAAGLFYMFLVHLVCADKITVTTQGPAGHLKTFRKAVWGTLGVTSKININHLKRQFVEQVYGKPSGESVQCRNGALQKAKNAAEVSTDKSGSTLYLILFCEWIHYCHWTALLSLMLA